MVEKYYEEKQNRNERNCWENAEILNKVVRKSLKEVK